MPGILVDIKDIYKYNMNRLLNKIVTFESNNSTNSIGIIFIISLKEFIYVNELTKGRKTVDYINSEKFINNIECVYYVIYNIPNKLCEIRGLIEDRSHLKDVIKSVFNYLPKDVIIWTGIITTESSHIYIEEGFSHPYKCDRSPLGFKFKNIGIAFIKRNTNVYKLSKSSIKNKIKYLDTDDTNSLKCNIYARFTYKTIKYLKKLNNTKYDTELSGSLIVCKVLIENGKIVFNLCSDPNSLIYGFEEEVDAVWSRYNFHTHPKKAYENHGVKNGWPSSQDYIGFLELKNHTIFHTVVTLEGIYIISLSEEYDQDINKINRKYILKNYDINHLDDITPEKYIKQVNSIKYKGQQLFDVRYMNWKNAIQIFPVFFQKTNGNCLITDDTFNISNINI